MGSRFTRSNPVTVNDMLDGHVQLDLECLDRIYLNGYVPNLQVSGQVVQFLRHRGYPIPSPACMQQIGDTFRRAVDSFARSNNIPVVKLKAADRNIDLMRPHLEQAEATGRSQVAAIGTAREFQNVFTARKRDTDPGKCPQFDFAKTNRLVTVYYFYLWDTDFGAAFIKICSYFPYPMKVYLLTELREEYPQINRHIEMLRTTFRCRDRSRRNTPGCIVCGRRTGWFADGD
jgi:hypothetical protein